MVDLGARKVLNVPNTIQSIVPHQSVTGPVSRLIADWSIYVGLPDVRSLLTLIPRTKDEEHLQLTETLEDNVQILLEEGIIDQLLNVLIHLLLGPTDGTHKAVSLLQLCEMEVRQETLLNEIKRALLLRPINPRILF